MTDELENDIEDAFNIEESTDVDEAEASKSEPEDDKTEDKAEQPSEEEATDDKKSEDPAPPAEDEQDQQSVPKPALLDERRKRQEAEKELERLKALLPQTDEEPDMYEDAEKWKEWNTKRIKDEMRAEQEKVTREKLDNSRTQMLEQASDYDEMERIFEIMAMKDQDLIAKMLANDNPAKFAYDTAKTYKEKLLGKAEPEVKKEPSEADLRKQQAIDGVDLSNATAQDSNTPKVEKEATLEDVFGDQKY